MAPSSPATIHVGPIQIDFLVDADDSDGSVTVFECLVPVGSKVPLPHSHDAFEETIYGLEGTCTWTVDGQTHQVGPGESVCIRRGLVHGFENRGDVRSSLVEPGATESEY
jgi:quercetin dioxygenase-like cupin family protein